ncbi:hypothetical protein EYF80_046006 [Liparis tanakae]|uniref:Uncharacterized protein n=1 Tax=Liparis tanakae TaxID=230148 RepID=A0A4Z2FRL9_9TELE|nr:hypothetical protein EYF80_046006 [Liparis tanakae]
MKNAFPLHPASSCLALPRPLESFFLQLLELTSSQGKVHLGEQRVARQISQKMALVQILLDLQADAAYFG